MSYQRHELVVCVPTTNQLGSIWWLLHRNGRYDERIIARGRAETREQAHEDGERIRRLMMMET